MADCPIVAREKHGVLTLRPRDRHGPLPKDCTCGLLHVLVARPKIVDGALSLLFQFGPLPLILQVFILIYLFIY